VSAFKKLVNTIEMSREERDYFIRICSCWELYCASIARFDKLTILKLLKYLINERPKSVQLLGRGIGRFNRLNMLRPEDLQ
jgi:hypothetical protein